MQGVRLRLTSFRMQIALIFGVIVLVLITALTVLLGRLQANTIRQNAGTALEVVATNAQRILAVGLHRRLVIVERLAAASALWQNGLDSAAVKDALAQQQMVDAALAWIGVADTAGIVRTATGGLLVGASVTARPWFGEGLKGLHVGDVHQALLLAKLLPPSATGEPQRFVDFAAPIRVDGVVRGVLALHGSWDWTRGVIESQLPEDAHALAMDLYILDRAGTVIYAPNGRDDVKLGDRFQAIADRANQPASILKWVGQGDYLTAVATLKPKHPAGDLGWLIVARMPRDVAYASVSGAVGQVTMFGVFAALIAMALAWVVSGSISRPLSAIQTAAQDVLNGKAGARIPQYSGNDELRGLSGALIDMTENLESRVREHTRLARFDPLTKLLNRRGFEEHLGIAVASAQRRSASLSVIAIDIDHFKAVNDRYGHDVGDRVLTTLADLMRGWFRESDIVARIGGEEFTVLLLDTDLAGAHRVAEHLVRHVAASPFPEVGTVTISCGVSKLRGAEEGFSALKRADRALYRAKSDGRNRTVMLGAELETEVESV